MKPSLMVAFATGVVLAAIAVAGIRLSAPEAVAMHSASSSTQPKQLYTCGMHPQVIQDHPGNCPICHMKLTPVKDSPSDPAMQADERSGGPTVKIDPTIVQNMGVRTAAVTRGPLTLTIRAVGMLEVPEPAVAEVNLKINGWIEKLYANTEGMHVHKGEPLFDLYSPDIQVASEELIGAAKASNGLDAGASDVVRTQSRSMVASAQQKLRLWGISDDDINAIAKADSAPRTFPYRSPADGDLVEKMVVEGSAVQAGMKLMRIEDHSKLWLNAQVYEQEIPSVALGQKVEAQVDGLPGTIFSGPVMFIYPHVDHMTRTTTVRIELDNPRHELRPGMYATATIVTRPVADAVLVPREAVIDTGTRQIAFVAEPQGHFEPRRVRMGLMGDDDQVQILEGLAPGETVVTSGQFLMDVESRTTEAIEKLRGGSDAGSQEMAANGAVTTTAPSTSPASMTLVVAHCPMKNADWLQIGQTITNPYFGTAMAACGSVTRTVSAPSEGSPLDALADNYLLVAKAFDADTLDKAAIDALNTEAGKLPADQYAALQHSVAALSKANDLASARTAFEQLSADVIHALDSASK